MKFKEYLPEVSVIVLASLVLAVTVSIKDSSVFLASLLAFFVIIVVSFMAKKLAAYHFEIDIKLKFWEIKNYGFRKDQHFKKAVPMVWLPLVLSVLTSGYFYWLGVLEHDARAKPERASKRHGLYRFTEITERHLGWISVWGVIATLVLGVFSYVFGAEYLAKLSFYYAMWSVIPFGRLDGTRILFANKVIWLIVSAITFVFFFLSLGI